MRGCDIQDLVLIKGDERSILCIAYPVEKLKKNVIVFPKDESLFTFQELVTLHNYEEKVRTAECILVDFSEKSGATNESMKNFILTQLSK